MSEMIDLALGKPATQSSKHPDIVLPLAQVASEAVQPPPSETSFHTASEWYPWWQVDLEQICVIRKVVLHNTEYWPIRSKMFTILISNDGSAWQEVYSRIDHTPFGNQDDTACSVDLNEMIIGRFVRIRLDNWNPFHLKRVQVFGTALSQMPDEEAENALYDAARADDAKAGTVVFATNFNEEDSFLPVYIENFLNFTDETCHLVINFPAGRNIPVDPASLDARVHVFNGRISRNKWGGTLLLGHMESYGEALRQLGTFDYFCTCATNALFVRPFEARYAIARLGFNDPAPVGMTRHFLIDVPLENVPRGEAWVWDNMQDSEALRRYLIDEADIPDMSLNQIEGLFAEKQEWDTLYERVAILEKCAACFPNPVQSTPALEEFLPVTFFRRFGKSRFTNICHMLWDPIRELTFADLVALAQKMPAHMCQAKWFSRHPDSMPTAALTREWGRALLATLNNDITAQALHQRIVNRVLVSQFNKALQAQETYTPLTRAWRDDARWGRVQWIGSDIIRPGHQQDRAGRTFFSGLPVLEEGHPTAWIETLQPLHDEMQFEAILAEDHARSTLSLETTPVGDRPGRHEWSPPWAALFVSPLQGEKAQLLRVTLRRPFASISEQLMYHVRRSDGVTSTSWQPVLHEDEGDRRHFYFLRPESHEGEIWIGLPVYRNTAMQIELSFGIAAV